MLIIIIAALDFHHHTRDLSFWGYFTSQWHQAKLANTPSKCSIMLVGETEDVQDVERVMKKLTYTLGHRTYFVLQISASKSVEQIKEDGLFKMSHILTSRPKSRVLGIK